MGKTETPFVSDFASFRDIHASTSDGHESCIWYIPGKRRTCRYPIDKDLKKKAGYLKERILQAPGDVQLDDLVKFAKSCCCANVHRASLVREGLLKPLAQKWQRELQDQQPTSDVPARPSSLQVADTPSVPAQPSSQQVADTPSVPARPPSQRVADIPSVPAQPSSQRVADAPSVPAQPFSQRVADAPSVPAQPPSQRAVETTLALAQPASRRAADTASVLVEAARRSWGVQTRSQSRLASLMEASSLSAGATAAPSLSFSPHIESQTSCVATKLCKDLEPKTAQGGSIYLYRHEGFPTHVKIGYVLNDVKHRLRRWERQCGYRPILQHTCDNVPHVWRVEMLIHAELADAWRSLRGCRCGTTHKEWFEIDTKKAIEVAEQWAEWVRNARPYVGMSLKPIWMYEIQKLKSSKIPVTAKALLEAHERMTDGSTLITEPEHLRSGTTVRTTPSPIAVSTPISRSTVHPPAINEEDTETGTISDPADTVHSFVDRQQQQQQRDLNRAFELISQAMLALVRVERAAYLPRSSNTSPSLVRLQRHNTTGTMISAGA